LVNRTFAVLAAVLFMLTAIPSGLARADDAKPVHLVATWGTLGVDVASVWLANDAGYFKDHGLDVDLQYQAGSVQIPSLITGEVQIATVGGAEIVSADAGGADLVVLASISPVYPYYFIASNAIKSPADLRGKAVGVTRIGDTSDLAARGALRRMNIDPKDVTFVAVGSASNRLAAMLGGATQAGVFQMPGSDKLLTQGFHSILDLAKLKIPAAYAIAARRDWVRAHPAVVQAYIDAIVQGLYKEKHDKAYTVALLKRYFKSDDDKEMNATWDFYTSEVAPTVPRATPAQFADALGELERTNDKIRNFDVSKIIDNSFVERAAQKYHLH
jgi:NitT/TauT family transport system substrate-binding protein